MTDREAKRGWTPALREVSDRLRQRHDHLMSSPLPLEPKTLADDPLPVKPADCGQYATERCGGCDVCLAGQGTEPPASEPGDPIATSRKALELLDWADRPTQMSSRGAREGFRSTIWHALDTLERDRAAHAAEVERLRGELATYEAQTATMSWQHDSDVQQAHHRIVALETELAEARARPEPSDEELTAKFLYVAQVEGYPLHSTLAAACARAAKAALLGVGRPLETAERENECLRLRINEVASVTYERLDKLELDARVSRKLAAFMYRVLGTGQFMTSFDDAIARIEREEKGGG